MKKYLLSTLAAAGILACTTAVSADMINPHRMYAVGEAGMGIGLSENGNSGLFGIGAGYHMNDYMRMDMTVGYRPWGKVNFKGSDSSEADMWSVPVMANAYMSYPIARAVEVYGMGGLGMSYNKTDGITNAKGKSRVNFAWTVGAGVSYALNQCWTLDLGYRFTDLGAARVNAQTGYDGKTKQDVRSNDIKLSARYYF